MKMMHLCLGFVLKLQLLIITAGSSASIQERYHCPGSSSGKRGNAKMGPHFGISSQASFMARCGSVFDVSTGPCQDRPMRLRGAHAKLCHAVTMQSQSLY